MKKLTKFYMLSFLLSAFVISSCTEDEITGEGDGNVIESEGYLDMSELAENPVSLTAEQGTYILKVFSDKEWTASVSYTSDEYTGDKADEWCILSSKTGVDASEIYIGFTKNKWNVARSASVDFSFDGSDERYSLALNQEASETVYGFVSDDINENGLKFKKSGQTYKVNLVTNAYEWTVSLVDDYGNNAGWCSLEGADEENGILSGNGDAELTITAVENETDSEQTAFLKFSSLDTDFDNKLILSQNGELLPFEKLNHEIKDDGVNFKFNWSDETEGATFKLTLAKDENYTEIIDEINDIQATDNSFSIDLSTIDYGSYIGKIYAKLECNNPTDGSSAIIEDNFNTHFDVTSGDGTENAPYIISNARHLKNISKITETGRFFSQTEDITLSDEGFTPLCPSGFDNTFDGNNKVISGLKNNQAIDFGLFTQINASGIVRSVNLTNVNITNGLIIGSITAKNQGTVTDCTADGSIEFSSGNTNIGGLIGNNLGKIEKCINGININVNSSQGTGGVCGYLAGGTISMCGNTGDITSTQQWVGGVLGKSAKNNTMTKCFNHGKITGFNNTTGGIVGHSTDITIIDSYNSGDISSTNVNASGILGMSNNAGVEIENCYNVGNGTLATAITNKDGLKTPIKNCFYLESTATSAAPGVSATGNESKSESAMKQQATYSGWDFSSVWTMSTETGYPKLQWEE